ncbi:hypothetical protein DFH09DRAFT_1155660 [Mycena vulgaris]|nr:hypothetical protein DFH09DRAFT_1155660 [Mycena vulgaris]
MLSRLFRLIFFVSLLTGVLAYPPGAVAREPVSQCNTGDAQCCQEFVSADNAHASEVLRELGIAVVGKTDVGLTWSPRNLRHFVTSLIFTKPRHFDRI